MRRSSWFLALALTASMVALVGGPATAGHPGTTVFVDAANCPGPGDGSEGDPFCSIQAGVNHANNGDTVSVAAGTYAAEPGNQVQINQNNLTLEGAKAGVPAGPAASPANRGSDESVLMGRFHFSQNRPGTVIDGFWVESGLMSGINALRGVPATAVNNVLRGTPAPSGIQAGILVQNLNEHYIAKNNIQGYRQGINADGGLSSAQSVIEKNYLANTTLSTIFFNSSLSNGHIIRKNFLEDNATGIFVTQGEHEIHMNTVQNGTGNGIAVLATARTFGLDISGNDLFNNLRGISLSGDHADAVDNEGHNNNIVGNGMGILSTHSAEFNGECNWWGSATGPTDPAGNPTGTGDSSTGNVDYIPWLTGAAPAGSCDGSPPPPPNPPPSKDACKKGGWEAFTDDEGTPFKNQGDCVSFVATGGKKSAKG